MPINNPNGNEVSEIVLPNGNTANAVIGPDGNAVFGAIPASVIDDFESNDLTVENGDWNDWSGATGNLTVQQSTVLEGSYTGQFDSNNEDIEVNIASAVGEQTPTAISFEFQIDSRTGNDADQFAIRVENGGSLVWRCEFRSDGDIVADASTTAQWSTGTHYRYRASNIDFGNNQYDLAIKNLDSDSLLVDKTDVGFFNSNSGIDDLRFRHRTDISGGSQSAFIDLIGESE